MAATTQDTSNRQPTLRKRANTIDLEVPEPEATTADYSPTRVSTGKTYAERRLRSETRKPSPMQEMLLLTYLSSCDAYLETVAAETAGRAPVRAVYDDPLNDDGQERRRRARMIRDCEKELAESCWMEICETNMMQELCNDILDIRRVGYYIRYGSCCKSICRNLMEQARAEGLEDDTYMWSGKPRWARLANMLKEEEPLWNKLWDGSKRVSHRDSLPTSWNVLETCTLLGVDVEQTWSDILMYASHKESELHDQSLRAVWPQRLECCDYEAVKQILIRDLKDVPVVCPARMAELRVFLQVLIELKLHRWWIIGDISSPADWEQRKNRYGVYILDESQVCLLEHPTWATMDWWIYVDPRIAEEVVQNLAQAQMEQALCGCTTLFDQWREVRDMPENEFNNDLERRVALMRIRSIMHGTAMRVAQAEQRSHWEDAPRDRNDYCGEWIAVRTTSTVSAVITRYMRRVGIGPHISAAFEWA